ncbi:MAG: group II intron reverse transcriptase/maturase [Hyphomicrobiales bacterium]
MSEKSSTTATPAVAAGLVPEWVEHHTLPEAVSRLRRKLYQKAKQEAKFRFYSLFGHVLRVDVLMAAWEQVRRNKGAPGVDGVTIDQIEHAEGGPQRFVAQLGEALRTRSYKPSPVRRVYIPKPDGRERPLGIPTVQDRVVQTAVLLVLEPIFEADFRECSYGFRPRRGAHQAVREIEGHLSDGLQEVYDADLKGYFDSIPHDKLRRALRMRLADRSVLKLIDLWLQAPVVDERAGGPPQRNRTGTPQGGVISPLLANVYLHWFDVFFHTADGPGTWAKAKLVRYADDFVILARYQGQRLQDWVRETLEARMGLEINQGKTRVVNLAQTGASLDFLGFTFRYDRDRYLRARRYLNVFPSTKAQARARVRVRHLTDSSQCFQQVPALIGRVNRFTAGWASYFAALGYPRKALRDLNRYVQLRMACHLERRSQRPYRPPKGISFYRHLANLGLVYR